MAAVQTADPPQAGDIIILVHEDRSTEQHRIVSIQTSLFGGGIYHDNVHDVVDERGVVHHVRRWPEKDRKGGARAWRHAPRRK